MSTDRETTRIVRSWLEEGVTALPDRVLDTVLDQVPATPQRRSWWPARRFRDMNNPMKLLLTAAAAVVVAVVGYNLLPRSGSVGGPPTPSPASTSSLVPSSNPTQEPAASPVSFTSTPFGADGFGMCPPPVVDPTCVEDPRDDSITFTFTIPEGWADLATDGAGAGAWIDEAAPPDGAAVTFTRGSWLYGDPCTPNDQVNPDIAVGPSVDDFVNALVDHPLLDVTSPVDATLAGYSGKYLVLQVPDDISECFRYRPIDSHIYAQGPGHRWRMWVLDVGGVRVLVEVNDYAGTSAARLAEEQGIVDSIEITP